MPTKLKSAEEWCKAYDQDQINHIEFDIPRKLTHHNGDYVRAIQLNALEAAVEIADSKSKEDNNQYRGVMTAYQVACEDIKQALLIQIEELKAKK